MYRGWTQTGYQNKHYIINQNDEGTEDDRGRDGGTKFILRIKELETHLTLQEHDDDDDDSLVTSSSLFYHTVCFGRDIPTSWRISLMFFFACDKEVKKGKFST